MYCLRIICSLDGFANLGHLRIWDICVFGTGSRRAPQAIGLSFLVMYDILPMQCHGYASILVKVGGFNMYLNGRAI